MLSLNERRSHTLGLQSSSGLGDLGVGDLVTLEFGHYKGPQGQRARAGSD